MAESYLTPEVRASSLQCQAAMAQEQLRRATPRPRSGTTAERSYPASKVRGDGWEEIPHIRGQGQWLMSHPMSDARGSARGQGRWPGEATRGTVAVQAQEGLEELSHVEGQEGRQ